MKTAKQRDLLNYVSFKLAKTYKYPKILDFPVFYCKIEILKPLVYTITKIALIWMPMISSTYKHIIAYQNTFELPLTQKIFFHPICKTLSFCLSCSSGSDFPLQFSSMIYLIFLQCIHQLSTLMPLDCH